MKMIKVFIMAVALILPAIANSAEVERPEMEITDALGEGNIAVVKQYLDYGTDVNSLYFAWTPLQIAVNNNQLEMVKFLIDKGADINYAHPLTKITALHLAAFKEYEPIVKYLISKGADVNQKMRNDMTIVKALRIEGQDKMADLLVAAGSQE